MKTLYLDAVGGVSGDMLVGALLDLADHQRRLTADLRRLPLPSWQLTVAETRKGAFRARQAAFTFAAERHHRHLADILAIIDGAAYASPIAAKVKDTFQLLAEAESCAHGIPVEEVHFHEVGAVDTILDIVAVVLLLSYLKVTAVYASPLPLGRGCVEGSHGPLPLPAPAVFALLPGVATYGVDVTAETVTPTGLALLKTYGCQFGRQPSLRVEAVGCGAGSRMLPFPNLLRATLGQNAEEGGDYLYCLETVIDDMTGEQYGYLWQRCFEQGALDLYYTPIQMKKGRPGLKLTVLAPREYYEQLRGILLQETATFGLICRREQRFTLSRHFETVTTPLGPVTFKCGEGYGAVKAAPEYEDLAKLARQHGLPLIDVYRAALATWSAERNQE